MTNGYIGSFTANLEAAHMFINMKYLEDPFNHRFIVHIYNQSNSTLYFKITIASGLASWTITSPATGQLGSIAAGSNNYYGVWMQRAKPVSDTEESGDLRIEAFTDAGYSDSVGSSDLPVTAYIEDIENWTDTDITTFDDGTFQGWSQGGYVAIQSDKSIEVGGYSARMYRANTAEFETYIEKEFTLPDRDNVRIAFFFAMRGYKSGTTSSYYHIKVGKPSIEVIGETDIFDIPYWIINAYTNGLYDTTYGWFIIMADLSAYRGQTKTIRLNISGWANYNWCHVYHWWDRIVIAGKDNP